MPELPEVQTIVEDLKAANLIGASIIKVAIFWPRTVFGFSPSEFKERVMGCVIKRIFRRGKYIAMALHPRGYIVIHLRMTGRFNLIQGDAPRQNHEHIVMTLSTRERTMELRFHDTRKFGRFYWVKTTRTLFERLGPEPLSPKFTKGVLAQKLQGRKRRLKPLLLDQGIVAGLGNIYVDEALFEARLHPLRLGGALSLNEIKALHRAIRNVLRRGLDNRGTSLGNGQSNFFSLGQRAGTNRLALKVFRRTGLPCHRCQTPIERLVVAQRSSHICPRCQVLGAAGKH